MKVSKCLGWLVAALASVLSVSVSVGQPLLGGVARVNLTPPLEWKYSLGGYGARMSKPAEGIHDWIWAKALVLKQGETRFVLVTADILAFPPTFKPKLVERLKSQGWGPENIMLLPSHSHASLDMSAINSNNVLNLPQIGIYDPRLESFVLDKIEQVIREASAQLQPVLVGTLVDSLQGLNRNRRGDGITDRALTVTRIDREDGTPLAVLVNWTAHPTIMSDEDMLVSAGWPGVLQRELEVWIGGGITAMYYNGAEGDQSPAGAVGGSHYEQIEDYGRKIAKECLALYRRIEVEPEAPLACAYGTITLPERQAHPQFALTGGAEYGLTDEKMRLLLDTMVPARVGLNVVRIGELVIAGVPGEMIASLGLRIKEELKRAGVPFPTIGGLANEWISYILSPSEYREGGYEASVSFYGPELGPTVVEGVLSVASELLRTH